MVLTARLVSGTAFREKDGTVSIIRLFVPQTLINRMLSWREKIFRRNKTQRKVITSSGEFFDKQDSKDAFLSKFVRWINVMSFMFGATIWLFCHRREIDIIHVHIADWHSGYAGLIGSYLGIPVICKASNLPVFNNFDVSIPFRKSWEIWRRKIHYVAMHVAIRDQLVECGVKPANICIIPNGVVIHPAVEKIRPEAKVLFVGNFSQGAGHKGFDVLLGAWEKVCHEMNGIKLVMAGDGDSTKWQRMASLSGFGYTVCFEGYVQNIDDLYRTAALFVLPSRHEGMSNALLEAQSWGVPAIVTDIPGNRAVVEDGVTGLVVPVGDKTALAHAIVMLLKDPAKREDMGQNARIRIAQQFSLDTIAIQYIDLYNKLVSGKCL